MQPLIIVTGTVHVEGGAQHELKTVRRRGETSVVMHRQRVSESRRAANVIATSAMRGLKRLAILRTPWGYLLKSDRQVRLEAAIREIDRRVLEFNRERGDTKIVNAVIWEPLNGKREAAVAAWLRKNKEARQMLKDS